MSDKYLEVLVVEGGIATKTDCSSSATKSLSTGTLLTFIDNPGDQLLR